MKLEIEYINKITFDEVKNLKLYGEDEKGCKFYITIECLYGIFETQYDESLNKFANERLKDLKGY